MKNIRTPLRQVRKRRGFTLENVKKGTGIDISTLSRIENMHQSANQLQAEKLCRFLGSANITEMEILYPTRFMDRNLKGIA